MCTKICIKLSSQIEIIFGIFSKTPSEKRKICLCFSEHAFKLSTKLPQINCFNYTSNRNTYCPNRCKTCDGGSGVAKPASQSGCSNSGYFSESVCSSQATPAVCASNPRAIMGCRSTCQTCKKIQIKMSL